MQIAIMVEGQMGLNWGRWQRIARLVEDLGFAGLFRSDHFTNPSGPDEDSLELYVSLAWLADNTQRIEFGALVTPVSFRHPVFIARMGYQLDDLANGRHIIGVGAGWQVREHHSFGFDLLDIRPRFDRFREGLEVVTRLIRQDNPLTYHGNYYQLNEALLLPRPQRRTPILVGGNGMKRTLPYAAEFADEWNAVFLPPAEITRRQAHLDTLLAEHGRTPASLKRSMMTGLVFGQDDAAYTAKLHKAEAQGATYDGLRAKGILCGTPTAIQDQLAELRETGLDRVMIQWLDLDDMDGLEAFARAVL